MLAPRLTAVVVLPTPPFWFVTATTVPIGAEPTVRIGRKGVRGRTCGSFWASVLRSRYTGERRATKGGSSEDRGDLTAIYAVDSPKCHRECSQRYVRPTGASGPFRRGVGSDRAWARSCERHANGGSRSSDRGLRTAPPPPPCPPPRPRRRRRPPP